MYNFDLFADFIFANLYWFGIREDFLDYADYLTDLHNAWVIPDGGNLYLLHSGRLYGYDFTDQPCFVDWAVDGKRILWEVGEMDVETANFGVCLDGIATDVCGANWILGIKYASE